MKSSRLAPRLATLAAAVLCTALADYSRAAEAPSALTASDSPGSLQYRRVFVPADRPDDWPTADEQYLPVDRAEFARLVQAASEKLPTSTHGDAHVTRTEISARWTGDDSLTGVALFEVKQSEPGAQWLDLTPFSACILGARWSEPDGGPAVIGALGTSPQSPGAIGVVASGSSQLAVDWVTAPTGGAGDSLEYALEMPAAIEQRLVLELPMEFTASIERGRVVATERIPETRNSRWTFQLGPGVRHTLRVQRPASDAIPAPVLPLASITEAYRLAPAGLDYDAEVRIENRAAPLTEFRAALPSTLHVVDVHVDRQRAAWRRGENEMLVVGPFTASSTPRMIVIKAAGSLAMGQPRELPRLALEDVRWTEGASTLWIDPALELTAVVPRKASLLSIIGVGGAGQLGEAYRLQGWSSDAGATVTVEPKRAAVFARSESVVEFAGRELVATTTAHLGSERGEQFHFVADVAPEWRVDAVASDIAEALASWHVEELASGSRLHIDLRHSPAAATPTTLSITGRKILRRAAPTARLGELVWLRFAGASGDGDLLAVKDRRGGEIAFDEALTTALRSADELSLQERGIADGGSLVFAPAGADLEGRLRVRSRPARFQAEAWAELERTATAFEHRTEISCRPTFGAVDELIVVFARPLPPDAVWELSAGGNPLLVETLTMRQPSGEAGRAIAYRVRLPGPMAEPFGLQVRWRSERIANDSVNPVVIPAAAIWRAWAILRGDEHQVRVDAAGCAPAAAAPESRDAERAPIIGCFRLGDDVRGMLASSPSLAMITTAGNDDGDGVFCWHCDVDTLQFADGGQLHRLAYKLDLSGADYVELVLPPGLQLDAARIDDADVAIERTGGSGRCQVPLPTGRRGAMMTLEMSSRVAPIGFASEVAPPRPETSFDVLRGRWTVWASPRYAVTTAGAARADDERWLSRLFGPLAPTAPLPDAPASMERESTPSAKVNRPPQRTFDRPSLTQIVDQRFAPRGWMATSLDYAQPPQSVRIQSLEAARATWYAALLAAAVATTWLASRHAGWAAWAAVIAAVCCLVLPARWIVVTQPVFLGILAGLVVRLGSVVAARSAAAAKGGAAAVLLWFAAASVVPVRAADSQADPPASVLYPVDAAGQLEGNDVYVPAPLLSNLLAESQRGKAAGLAATFEDARYSVILERNETNGELVCESATLILRCQASQLNSRIDIPLRRDEAQWLADQHTADGAPVELIWNADGVGCTVALPRAGANELRLRCVPAATINAGLRRARLHVPPVPTATVEANHPAGVEGLAVPRSMRVPRESHAARTVFRIPAGEVLDVAWPAADRRVAPQVSVDQLTWLHVDPVAARVDVRLKLTGNDGSLRELELATAPQLKLLPLAEDSPLQMLEPKPGSAATVRLKFAVAPRLPLEFSLAFQVQRTMSVGRIAYPEVRVLGVTTGTRHFAVTVDPRLRARDEPTPGFESTSTTQLTELWGDGLGKPQWQFAVMDGAAAWRLDVEPAPTRFKQRDSLDLHCEPSHARIEFSAELSEVEGEVWMHRVTVPADMTIESVEVNGHESAGLIPLRWSRPRSDELQVFLGGALTGAHVLRITGRVPYGEGGRLPLPAIGLADATAAAVTLSVTRSSDVLVQWNQATPALEPLEGRQTPVESTGALVGRYEVAASTDAAPPELLVSPNAPRFAADTLVTIDPAPGQPTASCIVVGRVTAGVVDRVRLLADPNWRGPFQVEPTGTATAKPVPQENRRQLIDVQLATPIAAGQELKLRISGGVALAADQLLRMPEVRIVGADVDRTYVVLPDGEWMLRGLRPEPLSQELVAALGAKPRAVFQAEGPFVAERRAFPEIMRTASVPLVDTRAVTDDRGDCAAVSELLLYPGRGGNIAMKLPQGAELLHAAIDGRSVSQLHVEDDLWQLPGESRDLPRIVELSYRYRPVRVGEGPRYVPPLAIVDGRALWPQRALWQVADGAVAAPRQPAAGKSLTASGFAAERERAWVAAALQTSPLAFQLPQWECREWFRPWLARLPIGAASQQPSGATSPDDAAWKQLQTQLAELIPPAEGEVASAAATLAEKGVRGDASWFRAGSDGSLTLSDRSAGSQRWRSWLLALAILAWAAAIRKHAARLTPVVDFVTRWPQTLGLAAGLAWWALLTPSWVGLAIALASCLAFFAPRYWGRAALSAGGPRYRADSAAEPVRSRALSRGR